MAIICSDYDLLFTHVPKTGGIFVEESLSTSLGGEWYGSRHSTFRWLRMPNPPSTRVMVVREPVAWYRSYWAFSRSIVVDAQAWPIWSNGRADHPTASLDRTCGSPTFEGFVEKVLANFPNGFVRSMYCDFANGITHVLRTEHLTEEFEVLLELLGYDDPALARRRPRLNESKPEWVAKAVLPAELEAKLREVDNLDGLKFAYLVDR